MSDSSEMLKIVYMESSSIRFDINIPMGSIFGLERDRYCRHMFERADLQNAHINAWQMWQRVEQNVVACKCCRLYTASGYITHECGWWERMGNMDGMICFCFCHDDLGYALNDGDPFVFCDCWRPNTMEPLYEMQRLELLQANELHIDHIIGLSPEFWISFVACRDGNIIVSNFVPDDDGGVLQPTQILSIRAFSGFIRLYKTFKAKVQDYRSTMLGQFMTMQSKRYFQRCSKSLWILGGDKEFAIVMHLQLICLRAIARSQETASAVAPNFEGPQIQMQLAYSSRRLSVRGIWNGLRYVEIRTCLRCGV